MKGPHFYIDFREESITQDQSMAMEEMWNSTDLRIPAPNSTNKWFHSSFITDNETEIDSLIEELKPHDVRDILQQVYPFLASVTMLLQFVVAYLFILLTLWERYGMDPMKRGITNRVSPLFFQ